MHRNKEQQILAIDIGNSQVKIGYNGSYWATTPDNFANSLIKLNLEVNYVLALISSVNSSNYTLVETALILQKIKFKLVDDLLSKQILINLSRISNSGQDRILGIFGALTKAKQPLLVVDCGTAMTLNYLDSDLTFLGGAILPGLYTQFDSLNSKTDKIKVATINNQAKFPASNTIDAVSSGILLNLIGAIESAIKLIDEENLTVVITGGYSEIIYDLINKEKKFVILENYLVCKGIFYLEEKQRN